MYAMLIHLEPLEKVWYIYALSDLIKYTSYNDDKACCMVFSTVSYVANEYTNKPLASYICYGKVCFGSCQMLPICCIIIAYNYIIQQATYLRRYINYYVLHGLATTTKGYRLSRLRNLTG